MALSRKDEQTLASIRAAAEKLRAIDEPALAAHVDSTLTPEHLAILKRAAWDKGDPSLPINMPKDRYEAIKAKAKIELAQAKELKQQGKDDKGLGKLATVIDAGFRRFLAGEFDPEPEPRAAWGTAAEKKTLNVRPDGKLHVDMIDRCRELRESGERPGVAVSNVAAAILYEHYRIGPYADDAETGTAG